MIFIIELSPEYFTKTDGDMEQILSLFLIAHQMLHQQFFDSKNSDKKREVKNQSSFRQKNEIKYLLN